MKCIEGLECKKKKKHDIFLRKWILYTGSRLVSRLHVLKAGMQEDVILLLSVVKFVPFGPVVADSVGEDLPIVVEAASGDWLFHLLGSLQFGTWVFVPERESAIGSSCCQGAMNGVKFDVVDSVDVLVSLVGTVRSMALESEIVLWLKVKRREKKEMRLESWKSDSGLVAQTLINQIPWDLLDWCTGWRHGPRYYPGRIRKASLSCLWK